MNTASTDLIKHLEILQEKLTHPTDYELALTYFLDEFAGDMGFHAEGTIDPAPHLRVGLSALVTQATGRPMSGDRFLCSFLHAYDFFHGHARTTDSTIIFFYFAKANVGLAALISLTDSRQQVARFQLPGIAAGNPSYN